MCVGERNWFRFLKELLLCRRNKISNTYNFCELPFNSECHFWKYGLLQKNQNWSRKTRIRIDICCFDVNAAVERFTQGIYFWALQLTVMRIECIMQHCSKYWKSMTCQKQHLKCNNLKITGCSMMTHAWGKFCHAHLMLDLGNLIWNLQNVEKPSHASGVLVSSRVLISTQKTNLLHESHSGSQLKTSNSFPVKLVFSLNKMVSVEAKLFLL